MSIGYEESTRKIGKASRKNHLNNLRTRSLINDIQQPPQLLPPRFGRTKCSALTTQKFTRKRRLPPEQKALLKSEQRQLQDADIEKWLESTDRFPETKWRIKEKRALKTWFDRLDADHSGEIDIEELADPLLSSGLAKSMTEVKMLLRSIDEDGSNGIGFEEFLDVMKCKNKVVNYKGRSRRKNKIKKSPRNKSLEDNTRWKRKTKRRSKEDKMFDVVTMVDYNKNTKVKRKKQINPIVQLTEREQNDNIDIGVSLCIERRRLLLDATMGEADRRQRAFAKVQRWRKEMKQLKGVAKMKKLNDISKVIQQMEVNQAEKENVVQAMKGILIREMELNPPYTIEPRSIVKSPARKDSAKRRNMMMLTERTKAVSRNGGRHALAFTRTRTPSIPTMLGIQRQGSISLLKKSPMM